MFIIYYGIEVYLRYTKRCINNIWMLKEREGNEKKKKILKS